MKQHKIVCDRDPAAEIGETVLLCQVVCLRFLLGTEKGGLTYQYTMVKEEIRVEGYENFVACAEKHKGEIVYALFCGSVNEAGESWCPDCVKAEPVIKECMKYVADDAIFVHCGVGPRDFWKDKTNIFRTDPKLRLKSVPTLLKLGTPQRLEEEQCANIDMVKMLLSDED